MPTVAVVSIPAEKMALSHTLAELDGGYCRVEKTAFTDADDQIRVWITCEDPSAIEGVLEEDPTVGEFSLVTGGPDERLYRLGMDDWLLLPREVVQNLDGQILEATASGGTWTLEVRFPDRGDVARTDDLFDRFEVDATFESITDMDLDGAGIPSSITGRQREVIETAIEEGYYEVPRQATLEELATELDVSHQALSECMRRAQKQLAEDQVTPETDQGSPQVSD